MKRKRLIVHMANRMTEKQVIFAFTSDIHAWLVTAG